MREILFRGKRIDSGEWAHGLLTIMRGQCHIIDSDDENTAYPVDPSTVVQYTGLTDKNGVKIFEGDIARYDDELVVVEWAEDAAMFMVRAFYGGILTDFSQIWGADIEVIGNIHENPELLEEES